MQVQKICNLALVPQQGLAIPIVIEDLFSDVAPGGHMVDRTVRFHSERTSHDSSKLSKQVPDSKIQNLIPYPSKKPGLVGRKLDVAESKSYPPALQMNQEIIARQRKAMAAEGLDALIAISPENVTYTTGIVVPSQSLMRWRHAVSVVTADGRIAMLVIDMEESTVRAHGGIQDLRVYREFVHDPMDKLCEALADLKLERAKLGIEMEYLPGKDLMTLQRRLPAAHVVAADAVFHRLRQVKSREELDLLRSLSRITDKAIGDALKGARAGMSEMEMAALLVSGIFAGGAENFKLMIIASGERSQYPNVGPTHRVLKEGDVIRMEIFGVLNGYHAGVCRTAVVGSPTAEQEKIWANLIECKYLVMDLIKPEAGCREVYQRFLKKFSELGFEPINFVGHGIGLFLHEEPYLGRYGDQTLEEGMVLAIEPLVFIPGRMGLQNKDMIAVTKSGCELLSDQTATDRLIRVA